MAQKAAKGYKDFSAFCLCGLVTSVPSSYDLKDLDGGLRQEGHRRGENHSLMYHSFQTEETHAKPRGTTAPSTGLSRRTLDTYIGEGRGSSLATRR